MTALSRGSVLSANVRLNNLSDESKKYEIIADVSIVRTNEGYGNGQIQNGSVSSEGRTVATWSMYDNLSIQYYVSDSEVQADILSEVQDFATSVKDFTQNAVLTAKTAEE